MNLSEASGLVLNADKTEILDERGQQYKVNYLGQQYFINGKIEVKINGVYFNKSIIDMRERNYIHLHDKISKYLTSWKNRQLSLLGKILIYKTFGLSQVTCVLTVIKQDNKQYKLLN
jgi:hypothetical protein